MQTGEVLLKGTPEDREVYINLAPDVQPPEALARREAALDKADELSTKPDDKEYVDFLRGSSYERQKKYDQAEDVFRKMLATDPQNAAVLELSRLHAGRPRRQAG